MPKRAERSVDCPAGRMVKSRVTVIILDLMESYLKFYLYRNIHSPLHGMEPKGLAFRQSFSCIIGNFVPITGRNYLKPIRCQHCGTDTAYIAVRKRGKICHYLQVRELQSLHL